MDFKQQIQQLKDLANSLMNGDSPKEVIDTIGKINDSLDSVNAEYDDKTKRLHDMTEAYIHAKTNEGSSDKPKEEIKPEETKPKSLEEIAKELIDKDKK